MKRLEGKVVLISGTGGGQGRVAALRFAREGAIVVGCDTNSEEHAKTAQLMEAEGYSLHGSAPIDLADHEQVRGWVESAVAAHGKIDVLYNNASAARFAPVQDMSIEDWHFTSAHSAAKGAVVSFTRQIAVEGAPLGIRAVSLSPGFIATPGTAAFMENPQARAALLDGVLMDRPGEPEEVVAMALFIASEEASFITGSDIVIDGGLLAI